MGRFSSRASALMMSTSKPMFSWGFLGFLKMYGAPPSASEAQTRGRFASVGPAAKTQGKARRGNSSTNIRASQCQDNQRRGIEHSPPLEAGAWKPCPHREFGG